MYRLLRVIFATLLLSQPFSVVAQEGDFEIFEEAYEHWADSKQKAVACYPEEAYLSIADQLVAGQNEDGGWPKNIDWTRRSLNPDSLKLTLKPRHRLSTLDNKSTYLQVEYLSAAYSCSGEERYRRAAERGMEYMLLAQHENGSWRGWDADAITFNDGVTTGVLYLWQRVIYQKEPFRWVDEELRERIEASWERGLEIILRTQYLQNGVKTIWAQQHDHLTLQPVKARSYELPALAPSESTAIVELLMRIRKPSQEVIEAVSAAVAWFERHKIEGKRLVTSSLPEGHSENPKIKRDRRLVDDPKADPLWARYHDLENNEPFLCNRDGVKVYSLEEVAPERRVGYSWYGSWPEKVMERYPEWLEKQQQRIAKERSRKQ